MSKLTQANRISEQSDKTKAFETGKHFVSTEDLTDDKLMNFLNRAIAFKRADGRADGETGCKADGKVTTVGMASKEAVMLGTNAGGMFTEETIKEVDGSKGVCKGRCVCKGKGRCTCEKKIFVANLFFEDSTRTHSSFYIAERNLGLDVLEIETERSSVNKGESLYDTILTLNALGVNICVIRHSENNYYEQLIKSPSLDVSIVNAGDGSGQHPSQCLLDLMTIFEEFGRFKGLKVAIAGDILHSRVARSNMKMLKSLGAEVYFSGPKQWSDETSEKYGTYIPIDELVGKMDVMMMLRVQHERHNPDESFSKNEYHLRFGLTRKRWSKMKQGAIIMHPAPVNRGVELADEIVEAPNSRIVQQMKNGVYARMAILESILEARKREAEI